ncbi:hypothetical protein B5S31_g1202 [[Candida] boidinii]|nr:hypothetical protein B5S31_g1202 [[Candida] boidinii]OWB76513.1 hypothetical protein B5S32_g665 [[Candida] boidinii]
MLFRNTLFTLLATASTAFAANDEDFPYIEVVGNKFFYSNNGSQFYMKGVAYQKDTSNVTDGAKFIDPLAHDSTCERDIPYLKELGTNLIRVYALDETANHDKCMELLQEAGIYVLADLSAPNISIITTDPTWTFDLYDRYVKIIDELSPYNNVMGFFAGNEVITNSSNADAAAFVKAAVRDTKAYIRDNVDRYIPVGYSANDDAETRVPSADYFACGDDDVKADFYGINMYEWCGKSSFEKSGFKDRTEEFSNLTIPVFFSEYGCNEVQPRLFTEVGTLYSSDMTDVWSGGIVYMYFEEDNNYGLVTIENNEVSTLADFDNLKSELANIDPTYATMSDASASATELSCPTGNANWKVSNNLPPTPDKQVCLCLESSLDCVVADDIDEEDYGDLFGVLCGLIDCSDISVDSVNGTYGAFSYCSPKEKLSYLLNKYYEENGSNNSACDFDGSATLMESASVQATATNCNALVSSASAAATKPSSNNASGSSGSKSSSGSGSSTGSASSSSSRGAAAAISPVALTNSQFTICAILSTVFLGALSAFIF